MKCVVILITIFTFVHCYIECGKTRIRPIRGIQPRNKRASGGRPARPGSWPWLVRLGLANRTASMHFCDGSLINRRWILTAAHCISNKNVDDMWVRAGVHDLENNNQGIILQVEKTIVHPKYKQKVAYPYDIGLVKLRERVKWNNWIRPICIGGENKELKDNIMLTIAGWGRTGPNQSRPSNIVNQVTIPKVPINQCKSRYPKGIVNKVIQFCAGKERTGGACKGDSGAPVIRKVNRRWKQFGIVSFGGGSCDFSRKPGVHLNFYLNGEAELKYISVTAVITNVAYYKRWIRKMIEYDYLEKM